MLTDLVTLEKPKKSSFGGLKRLGTIMSRRKESKQAESLPSPQKRGKPSRNPLRRGSSARDMHQIPSPNASMTELADTSARQAPPSRSGNISRTTSTEQPRALEETNGERVSAGASQEPLMNGSQVNPEPVPEKRARPPSTIAEEGERDVVTPPTHSSAIDDITRAQQEAAATENDQPQFKLDIRNQPIQEEDGDAQKALSNMANTLRAVGYYEFVVVFVLWLIVIKQAQPPQRKLGTNRGRRDVRNTIFVPNPSSENLPVGDTILPPASPFSKGNGNG